MKSKVFRLNTANGRAAPRPLRGIVNLIRFAQLYFILKFLIVIVIPFAGEILNSSYGILILSFPPIKIYKDITDYRELRKNLNRVGRVYGF